MDMFFLVHFAHLKDGRYSFNQAVWFSKTKKRTLVGMGVFSPPKILETFSALGFCHDSFCTGKLQNSDPRQGKIGYPWEGTLAIVPNKLPHIAILPYTNYLTSMFLGGICWYTFPFEFTSLHFLSGNAFCAAQLYLWRALWRPIQGEVPEWMSHLLGWCFTQIQLNISKHEHYELSHMHIDIHIKISMNMKMKIDLNIYVYVYIDT